MDWYAIVMNLLRLILKSFLLTITMNLLKIAAELHAISLLIPTRVHC